MKFLKYTGLCFIALFYAFSSQAQNAEIKRIDPPNWWVGMKYSRIQLMVYGKELGKMKVSLQYPGVTLLKSEVAENPNYLFLSLEISPKAQPGNLKLIFSSSDQKLIRNYELKKRSGLKPNGFNSSDLVYLLMPDRFANGDTTNDVVPSMRETILDRTQMYKRHGGDIKGITEHLDYLNDLGVTTVWPCPILTNDQPEYSYHGYAITDYYEVDPRYGNLKSYKALVDSLHTKGMKLVMDYVHNHCGSEHFFVKELPMKSWLNQHNSFTRTNYRPSALVDPNASARDKMLNSDGWFDHHMPDLNQKNPYLAKYLIQSNLWWVETIGLDGYRFDTYPYPDQSFMSDLNSALRTEYPTLSIVGEVWEHTPATTAWYQSGNPIRKGKDSELKSLTDFPFLFTIIEGLNEDFGWKTGLARFYFTIAQDLLYKNANDNLIFLDNHDLSRFYSEVKEDFAKWKLAQILLFTMRGTPQLYYGGELLMKNHAKPDGLVRQDIPGGWPTDKQSKFVSEGRTAQENEAFNFIRTLARWRKTRPSLYNGKLTQFIPEDEVFVYFRSTSEGCNMIMLNQGSKPKKVSLKRFEEVLKGYPKAFEILSSTEIQLTNDIELAPVSGKVFELKK